MANQNSFDPENNCELSYELLYLLKWLMDHESATFKKIITRAAQQRFLQKINSANTTMETVSSDGIQHSIVDFLDMLDILLHETLNEQSIKKAQQSNLIPAINRIDSYICNKDIVQGSLDKTTTHLELHPEINAKELLFKEILRRWKPANKKHLN